MYRGIWNWGQEGGLLKNSKREGYIKENTVSTSFSFLDQIFHLIIFFNFVVVKIQNKKFVGKEKDRGVTRN